MSTLATRFWKAAASCGGGMASRRHHSATGPHGSTQPRWLPHAHTAQHATALAQFIGHMSDWFHIVWCRQACNSPVTPNCSRDRRAGCEPPPSPPVLRPLVRLLQHRRHQRGGAVGEHLSHPQRRLLISQLRPQLLLLRVGWGGGGWSKGSVVRGEQRWAGRHDRHVCSYTRPNSSLPPLNPPPQHAEPFMMC